LLKEVYFERFLHLTLSRLALNFVRDIAGTDVPSSETPIQGGSVSNVNITLAKSARCR
jgi:hypothetical protein